MRGMSVWECAGEGERRGVGICGRWGEWVCGGVLVVLGFGDCDCIGDGIGVVGVESELRSRGVGLDGVGVQEFRHLVIFLETVHLKKKDKCTIFVLVH